MNREGQPEDEIQRMLALKRHEQPPPAFFQGFSGQVLDRIQSDPADRPTWRQKLSAEFYGVPLYVSLSGVVVCGLLVAGLISSLRVKPASPMVADADGAASPLASGGPTPAIVPPPPPSPFGNATAQGVAPAEGRSLTPQPVRASVSGGAGSGTK